MSTTTRNPPIRIRRMTALAIEAGKPPRPSPVASPAPKPAPQDKPKPSAPREPTKPPKPPVPAPAPAPVQPAAVAKPKGPAAMPKKPKVWPAPIKVDNPRRLRARDKTARTEGGIFVANLRWGSPFRPREKNGQWFAAWTGDQPWLTKPESWEDIPCNDRSEAAQISLEAFRDWITAPEQAQALEAARRDLRGFHLICRCPTSGWFCHADVLLELVNQQSVEPRLV